MSLAEGRRKIRAKPAGVADTAHHWRGMGVHVDSGALCMTFGHSGYMPGYVSWMCWYDRLGVSVALQASATDRARLVDDGFDWMDSMAVAISAQCAAPAKRLMFNSLMGRCLKPEKYLLFSAPPREFKRGSQ